MDYGPSTLEVLPEIVAAIDGRIPVLTDSGYRRGSDILKALALGANAVLLGRRTTVGARGIWRPGVERLLDMIQRELVGAAAAAGRSTLASIDKSLVQSELHVNHQTLHRRARPSGSRYRAQSATNRRVFVCYAPPLEHRSVVFLPQEALWRGCGS